MLGFLTEADNRQILGALTEHFTAGGELVLNAYMRIVARLMGSLGVLRAIGLPKEKDDVTVRLSGARSRWVRLFPIRRSRPDLA